MRIYIYIFIYIYVYIDVCTRYIMLSTQEPNYCVDSWLPGYRVARDSSIFGGRFRNPVVRDFVAEANR